jgi:hypothetical protein
MDWWCCRSGEGSHSGGPGGLGVAVQQMRAIIDTANSLHINSFTYDFHLRHFLSFVTVR